VKESWPSAHARAARRKWFWLGHMLRRTDDFSGHDKPTVKEIDRALPGKRTVEWQASGTAVRRWRW